MDNFILGNIQDLEPESSLIKFLKKHKRHIKIEKRFRLEPIKIKVKSWRQNESGMEIEFYTQEDADLFWGNQDKEIELVFNS